MIACAKANTAYQIVLYNKYRTQCHDDTTFKYMELTLKKDIENFDCKEKEKTFKPSPVSFSTNSCRDFIFKPC